MSSLVVRFDRGADNAPVVELPKKSCLRSGKAVAVTEVQQKAMPQEMIEQCQTLLKTGGNEDAVHRLVTLAKKDGKTQFHDDNKTLERIMNMYLAGYFEPKDLQTIDNEHTGKLRFNAHAARVVFDHHEEAAASKSARKMESPLAAFLIPELVDFTDEQCEGIENTKIGSEKASGAERRKITPTFADLAGYVDEQYEITEKHLLDAFDLYWNKFRVLKQQAKNIAGPIFNAALFEYLEEAKRDGKLRSLTCFKENVLRNFDLQMQKAREELAAKEDDTGETEDYALSHVVGNVKLFFEDTCVQKVLNDFFIRAG